MTTANTKFVSYLGDAAVKEKFTSRVKAHEEADQLVQGYGYWIDGKGCALGCTMELNEGSHQAFAKEIAPEWLAHLADHLFENLPKEDARKWTGEFLNAIPVGISEDKFNSIRDRFQIFWLERQQTQIDQNKYPQVKTAIDTVIGLLKEALSGFEPLSAAWSAAESAARSAARSAAESAAWSAAESAAWSAARSAARSAAESAARSAAWSAARSAAESAARSARNSEAQVKRDWILAELKALK